MKKKCLKEECFAPSLATASRSKVFLHPHALTHFTELVFFYLLVCFLCVLYAFEGNDCENINITDLQKALSTANRTPTITSLRFSGTPHLK